MSLSLDNRIIALSLDKDISLSLRSADSVIQLLGHFVVFYVFINKGQYFVFHKRYICEATINMMIQSKLKLGD